MFLINTSASNTTNFSYFHLFFVHRYSINITSTCAKTELTSNKHIRTAPLCQSVFTGTNKHTDNVDSSF